MARKSNKTLQEEARAAAAQAEAEAQARTAEAESRAAEAKAKADAARAESEAKAATAKLDADNRASEIAAQKAKDDAAAKLTADRAQAKKDAELLRTGSTVAGLVVGVVGGHKLAHTIDARFAATVAAKNAALKSVVEAAGNGSKALASIATAADKAGITRAVNPVALGLATAGLAGALVVEGGFARLVVSPQLEDSPNSQAIVDATATGSIVAAASLVGQQAVNMATPSAVLDAKALAHVEAARVGKTLTPANSTPPQKPGTVTVPKQTVPAPGTKAAMLLEAKQAGIKGAGKMTAGELAAAIQAAGQGSSLATKVAAKLLPALGVAVAVGAGMSAFNASAEAGDSKINGIAKGVAAGLDSFVLAGAGQQMVDLQRRHAGQQIDDFSGRSVASHDAAAAEMGAFGGMIPAASAPAPERPTTNARLALARAAAARAAVEQRVTQTLGGPVTMAAPAKPKRAKGSGKPGPDGFADGYVQMRNGNAVHVQGYKVTR